ncbi:MAG: MarR family winged helix-turn-helix transcriptional regulator [Pseudonocardia sp.]|nr:MarR family winged helix-turn-helix transcriptional regulator [Pseudonocardia sp.]
MSVAVLSHLHHTGAGQLEDPLRLGVLGLTTSMFRAEHVRVGDARGELALRVFGDLVRVVHSISQGGARELRAHGFTPAQYQVLMTVATNPDCHQQQLSDQLGVTKGNVSMLVSRLEDAGLLDRIADGPAHNLRLTEQGRDQLATLRPLHARFLAERFAPLGDDELAALARLVSTLDDDT